GRYAELAEPAVPDVLQDATVVVMRPLAVEQVARWLTHRFPEPTGSGGISERWRPVITRIRRHPTGRLATCLTLPLRLYLAAVAYQAPRSSPRDLIDVPAADLDAHLFAQVVPAATMSHPGPGGSYHDYHDVTVWLRTFATHLTRMAETGGSG